MIPLVTAFIAAVVAVIAFLQWQTAPEKVLLDLFDKRFALYEELRLVLGRYFGGEIHVAEAQIDFAAVASRAQFLFGHEVQTFLKERQEDDLQEFVAVIREGSREPDEAELLARALRVYDFFKNFDVLVGAYISHHQKARTRSLVELAHSKIFKK